MRLRVLIGARRGHQFAGAVVDIPVALRRAVDAVGPIEPGVEPLRRVGRAHLAGEHQPDLVVEGAGVLFGVEIAALPTPIGPGSGHPVEDLAGAGLAAPAGVFGKRRQGQFVGAAPPQPLRHAVLRHPRQRRRDAGLAKIFLRQDVGRDLAPFRRHLDALGLEHDRAVRVADLAGRGAEPHCGVGILAGCGKATRDMHSSPPKP